MSRTQRTRTEPSKPPLSVDTIVDAAMAVLEQDGIGALNMRRVAAGLGVSVMALYRHVATKDALLSAIADRYLAEVELPDTTGMGWREAIATSISAFPRAFVEHPYLGSLIALQHVDTVAIFQASEVVLVALREAGLGAEEAVQALDALSSFTLGLTQRKLIRHATGATRLSKIEALPAGEYTNVIAMAGQIATLDLLHSFESSLEWLLDGIEARVNRQTPSRRDVRK